MNDHEKKRQALDWLTLGLIAAISSILIPAIFPKEITVSPLLLFGIIFTTNIACLLIPDNVEKKVEFSLELLSLASRLPLFLRFYLFSYRQWRIKSKF